MLLGLLQPGTGAWMIRTRRMPVSCTGSRQRLASRRQCSRQHSSSIVLALPSTHTFKTSRALCVLSPEKGALANTAGQRCRPCHASLAALGRSRCLHHSLERQLLQRLRALQTQRMPPVPRQTAHQMLGQKPPTSAPCHRRSRVSVCRPRCRCQANQRRWNCLHMHQSRWVSLTPTCQ